LDPFEIPEDNSENPIESVPIQENIEKNPDMINCPSEAGHNNSPMNNVTETPIESVPIQENIEKNPDIINCPSEADHNNSPMNNDTENMEIVHVVFRKQSLKIETRNNDNSSAKTVSSKGQLISKCPFGAIVSTKIPTKFFPRFLP
jgi:hypothetical protein